MTDYRLQIADYSPLFTEAVECERLGNSVAKTNWPAVHCSLSTVLLFLDPPISSVHTPEIGR
jgi:hypothetical protein